MYTRSTDHLRAWGIEPILPPFTSKITPLRFGNTSPFPGWEPLREEQIKLQGLAQQDSANDPVRYIQCQAISPLTGHCAGVANYLQQRYGGTVVRAEVAIVLNGEAKTDVHYWNKWGNIEADLTSSQYGGDGLHPISNNLPKSITAPGVSLEVKTIIKRAEYPRVQHSSWFEPLYKRLGWNDYLRHPNKGEAISL